MEGKESREFFFEEPEEFEKAKAMWCAPPAAPRLLDAIGRQVSVAGQLAAIGGQRQPEDSGAPGGSQVHPGIGRWQSCQITPLSCPCFWDHGGRGTASAPSQHGGLFLGSLRSRRFCNLSRHPASGAKMDAHGYYTRIQPVLDSRRVEDEPCLGDKLPFFAPR